MEKKSVLMGAVPGVALAIFVVLAVPGSALVSNSTTDNFPVHGYVTVSVMRDGSEIYHHEDHNLITTAGQDFIREQIGQTTASGAIDSNGANFIALTTDTGSPAAGDTAQFRRQACLPLQSLAHQVRVATTVSWWLRTRSLQSASQTMIS
jgi:hypothetical protein